jgi:hypothetical protein
MSTLDLELRRRFGHGMRDLLLAHPIFAYAIQEATDFYQAIGIRVPVRVFVDRVERMIDSDAFQRVPNILEEDFVDR